METMAKEQLGISRFRAIAKSSTSFADCVRQYQSEGLTEGEAIQTAAKYKPEAYNEWCKAGRPAIQFVRQ